VLPATARLLTEAPARAGAVARRAAGYAALVLWPAAAAAAILADGVIRLWAGHAVAGAAPGLVTAMALVAAQVPATSSESLREMGDTLRDQMAPGVAVLGSVVDGRVTVVAMVGGNAGLSARDLVASVAPIIGGRGGGRNDVAQAGGSRPDKLAEALGEVVPLVAKQLGVLPRS